MAEFKCAYCGGDHRDADCSLAPPGGYAEWLKQNPEPTIQALIDKFGGYSKITHEGWRDFDRAVTEWRLRYRERADF